MLRPEGQKPGEELGDSPRQGRAGLGSELVGGGFVEPPNILVNTYPRGGWVTDELWKAHMSNPEPLEGQLQHHLMAIPAERLIRLK